MQSRLSSHSWGVGPLPSEGKEIPEVMVTWGGKVWWLFCWSWSGVKKMLGMVCEISSWAVFSKELPFWRMNQRERGIFLVLVFFLVVCCCCD